MGVKWNGWRALSLVIVMSPFLMIIIRGHSLIVEVILSQSVFTSWCPTILDKSPWDSLKTRHVFANRSVFDALEGRVCAKWRPPPPWSMLLRKRALSAHWYNIERGRGKSKRGDFQRKSAGVPTLLSRIVAISHKSVEESDCHNSNAFSRATFPAC